MKYFYKLKSWVMGQNKTVTSVTSVTTRPFVILGMIVWNVKDVKEKESGYGSPKWRTMAATSRFISVCRRGL